MSVIRLRLAAIMVAVAIAVPVAAQLAPCCEPCFEDCHMKAMWYYFDGDYDFAEAYFERCMEKRCGGM